MEPKQPQDTESRHADKYIVRFPDGMRDRLKDLAKSNNRTLNAEIVARLARSFDADREIEQLAFDSTIGTHNLEQEIKRLTALLEAQKDQGKHQQQVVLDVFGPLLEDMFEAREARMREWWLREFGYDPKGEPVKLPDSKGPAPRSKKR